MDVPVVAKAPGRTSAEMARGWDILLVAAALFVVLVLFGVSFLITFVISNIISFGSNTDPWEVWGVNLWGLIVTLILGTVFSVTAGLAAIIKGMAPSL